MKHDVENDRVDTQQRQTHTLSETSLGRDVRRVLRPFQKPAFVISSPSGRISSTSSCCSLSADGEGVGEGCMWFNEVVDRARPSFFNGVGEAFEG